MTTPRAGPIAAAAAAAPSPPVPAAAAGPGPAITTATTTAPSFSFPPGTAHIDGAMLEGGGQILRNAVALSGALGTPLAVTRIRAGRPKPGLSPQHATGLRLAARICGGGAGNAAAGTALLEGCEPRSTAVRFAPGGRGGAGSPVAGEAYEADTGTAGSCTLLAQQALPLLLLARRRRREGGEDEHAKEGGGGGQAEAEAKAVWSRVVMRGGTDASHAPPVGYLQRVLTPTLNAWLAAAQEEEGGQQQQPQQSQQQQQQQQGSAERPLPPPISLSLARRGFFPRGGGEAALRVRALAPGASLPPLTHLSERAAGGVASVDVYAFSAGRVPPDAARRAAEAAAGPIRAALAALAEQAAADGRICPPPPSVRLHTEHLPAGSDLAVGDGAGITCVAAIAAAASPDGGPGGGGRRPPPQLLGSSASGERGLRAEDMGAACGRALARQLCSGCAADEWLADQVVVLAALAGGGGRAGGGGGGQGRPSRVLCAAPLSLHARTAVAVAEQVTAAWAANLGGAEGGHKTVRGAQFRLVPVEGSRERAAAAARRAGFAYEAGEPGSEGLVLLECHGVGARAGG